MNLNQDNKYQLIDEYLEGGMSQTDIDKFKAFMQSDADLDLDVKMVTEIQEARAFSPLESQLRDSLSAIRKADVSADTTAPAHASVAQPAKTNNLVKYGITGLFLAAVLYLLFNVFGNMSQANQPNDAYMQFAMVEPLHLTTKGELSQEDIQGMEKAYNDGEYATALALINKYLESNPNDLDVLNAKSVSLTEVGNFKDAHKTFRVIEALNPRVKKYAWNEAMAYLKQNKITPAKKLLTDIVNDKSYNYEQAKKLLVTFK